MKENPMRSILLTVGLVVFTNSVLAVEEFKLDVSVDQAVLKAKPLGDAVVRIKVKGNQDWRGTIAVLDEDGYRVALPYVNTEEIHKAGQEYEYAWDGGNSRGVLVPSGTYGVHVEAVAVMPTHNWSGKWYMDNWSSIFFDSRGEEIFWGAINSQEQPSTDYEFPECYGRFYDFDGLPMSALIPLVLQNLCWGNMHFGMDLQRNIYTPTEIYCSYIIGDICKISGRTGAVLWRLTGLVDTKTGEPFVPDGSCSRPGRNLAPSSCRIWDTGEILLCKNSGGTEYGIPESALYKINAGNGRIVEEKHPVLEGEDDFMLKSRIGFWPAAVNKKGDRILYAGVRQFPDGGLLHFGMMSPMIKYDRDGKMEYILECADRNGNGSLYDAPTRENKWGESILQSFHDSIPIEVDAAGNFYGNAIVGRPQMDKGYIAKYNAQGQLLLHCLASEGNVPSWPVGELTVSQDSKLLAISWDHWQCPRFYELARGEVAVAVQSGIPPNPQLKKEKAAAPQTAVECLDFARALVSQNKDVEAVKYFLKVPDLTKDPDCCAVAYNLAGKALERSGQLDEAIATYQKLTALPWDAARGWLNMARCYQAKGDKAKTEKYLQEALKNAPDKYWKAKAFLEQGRFYEASGDAQKAAGCYEEVIKNYSHATPQGLLGRARCYVKSDKYEQALEDCRVIVEHYPMWSQIFCGNNSTKGKSYLFEPRECQKIIAQCAEKLGQKLNTEPRAEFKAGEKGDVYPDVVLGQKTLDATEYTQLMMGSPELEQRRFHFPQGLHVDANGFYVCDYGPFTHRISIFRKITGENFQPIDRKFCGENRYITMFFGTRLAFCDPVIQGMVKSLKLTEYYGWLRPVALTSEGNNYYVVPNLDHRVLVFEDIYKDDANPRAKYVLGQKDLLVIVKNNGGVNASSLNDPYGISTDGKRLYVADRSNHRVLIWNLPITQNYQPANLVLGQKDFTANERNASGVSASSLNKPSWVFSDGKRVVVSDCGNNRVLIWKQIPTRNNQPADIVLGADSFNESIPIHVLDSGYISESSFAFPMGIWIDGETLYICDMWNNRVMIWDKFPTRNNQPADRFLGQPSLKGIYGPYDLKYWYYGDPNNGAPLKEAQYTVGMPIGVCVDKERIYVSDFRRPRVLIYYK